MKKKIEQGKLLKHDDEILNLCSVVLMPFHHRQQQQQIQKLHPLLSNLMASFHISFDSFDRNKQSSQAKGKERKGIAFSFLDSHYALLNLPLGCLLL